MITIELIQGTPEWHAHRATHHNASDAPAMLGCSPYKTRAQLVRECATGVTPEIDAATQKRFDDGHRYEALARPLAEEIVGEELYPVVGVQGKYSASFDGLTLLEDTAFEHKSLNDELRCVMVDGCTGADLPEHYRIQMEQQMLVSGAHRVLFMASKWDGAGLVDARHTYYLPDFALRDRIIAGWEQFEADVAAYAPEVQKVEASGRAPETLPALRIEVTGMVTASNLAEWKSKAIEVFQNISTELTTDQDFADAETTVKWCASIEDQLKAAKQHALSQTESIDALFRTIDDIAAEARAKRLDLDKLVKRRKDERRTEIGNSARRAVQQYVLGINESLGEHGIQVPATLIADVGDAMRGKRSFASMQEAVDSVVANAKIAASQQADRVRANMAILAEHPAHASLFADHVALCAHKAPDDLRNLVAARIADHQQREQARIEQERERIRQQELARIEREQQQERARQQQTEIVEAAKADQPEVAPAAVASPAPQAPQAPAAAVRSGAEIRLGEINALIAPLTVSAEALASLGFLPVRTERAAKLYDADKLESMLRALARHLATAADRARDSYPMAA
ncbi:hypothetical protein EA658_16465 [Pseudoxanthomonas winnipegensis]|uniref:YqaJ viral recombinase domain-containing protein n=1 Tax=Pseudoxanthomonas winnipegensis TaxID=2480810 RepID=A0ABY1WCF7_9GAMM|nr:YqaJ viral recombinase family protein [Pseudoxanthomonas winnipegensis]TAA11256.1 hypothetical protein EA659_07880 [Pseudoxanthomonas winnipegensis]TAA18679.1 hypothetical protein EA658_16465 [Pseudoxanthomonas winnipegensis]TAH73945.1 hypothetical protein EA657_00280 [Pseudoxanthomonas winnipegensis]